MKKPTNPGMSKRQESTNTKVRNLMIDTRYKCRIANGEVNEIIDLLLALSRSQCFCYLMCEFDGNGSDMFISLIEKLLALPALIEDDHARVMNAVSAISTLGIVYEQEPQLLKDLDKVFYGES